MTATAPDKFQRYRQRRRAAGLKQVRLWVHDPEAPGFAARLSADIARINAAADAADADLWLAGVSADIDRMIEADEDPG